MITPKNIPLPLLLLMFSYVILFLIGLLFGVYSNVLHLSLDPRLLTFFLSSFMKVHPNSEFQIDLSTEIIIMEYVAIFFCATKEELFIHSNLMIIEGISCKMRKEKRRRPTRSSLILIDFYHSAPSITIFFEELCNHCADLIRCRCISTSINGTSD